MRVIYKDSTQTVETDYPNIDISEPVYRLDKDIRYYFIIEEREENTNPEQYELVQLPDELIDKPHDTYQHLNICIRKWVLKEINKQIIIDRLNNELGNYLDSEYPIWERNKHLQEFLFDATPERIEYIAQLSEWLLTCRNIRQDRENNYIINGIFPEFGNYPSKP